MARKDGSINYPLNFNVGKTAPLDSRSVVDYEDDLILDATWPTNAPPYNGMTVAVRNTGEVWILKDREHINDKTSGLGWKKVGGANLSADSGITIANDKISVKIGTGLAFGNDGSLNASVGSLPIATKSTTGVTQIGNNINVTANGVISVSAATNDTLGVVKPGNGLTVDNSGTISLTTQPVIYSPDSGISIDNSKISVNVGSGLTFQDDGGLKTIYQPADSSLTTMALGGIAAGTSASTLMGKTVSEVLDDLLFPTYIGKYTLGNTPTLDGGGGTYYIYKTTAPSITLNKNGTASTIKAGTYTITQTGPQTTGLPSFGVGEMKMVYINNNNHSYSPLYTSGTYKETWGESSGRVVDSKGKDCKYASSGSSTYLRSSADNADEQTKRNLSAYTVEHTDANNAKYWTLRSEERGVRPYIYVVYPYWAKTSLRNSQGGDITGGTQQSDPITSVPSYFSLIDPTINNHFEFVGPTESETDITSFLLPATFTNVKMLQDDGQGNWQSQNITSKDVWIKIDAGVITGYSQWESAIKYKLYTKTSSAGDGPSYKITFTISNI